MSDILSTDPRSTVPAAAGGPAGPIDAAPRSAVTRRAALRAWGVGTASLLLLTACGAAPGARSAASGGEPSGPAAARVGATGPLGAGPAVAGPGAGGAAVAASGSAAASGSSVGASSSGASSGSATAAARQSLPACVLTPRQTEGPYFVDERLNRSDIRPDPVTGLVSEGVPLKLLLQVSQVDGGACTPLGGIYVDLWQCDAFGVYSDVNDRVTGARAGESKFLRGYQVTDDQGGVEFTTVYPGWYPGRAVHIHFKVRTALDSTAREQISQFYFDDALSDQVHAQPPYTSKSGARTRNDRDGLYRNGGDALTVPVVQDGEGYVGTYTIGVRLA